ncbi:hypothetical protein ISCGN_017199 [Ixodes scapularis]
MVGRTERREAARCVIRSNVAVVCEESNRRLCAVNIDNVEDQSALVQPSRSDPMPPRYPLVPVQDLMTRRGDFPPPSLLPPSSERAVLRSRLQGKCVDATFRCA